LIIFICHCSSTLAFQGKNISQSFRVLVNIINGTSLGVNSVAVANSLAYMAIHFDDMTPMDVLMQVASVAFWAKSVFSYKPAAKIVKEIHNQVLNGYSTALGHAQDDFNHFRAKFNNDKQLVKFYFRYLKQGLDPAQISDVLVEIYQMGAGAQFFSVDPAQMTININGHTFTMEFLMTIKSCNRQTVFNILSGMNDKQTEVFNKLRSQIQDDVALFYLVAEVSKEFQLKPEDCAKSFIKFWEVVDDGTSKIPPTIKLNKDASITIGKGFTFNIDQIVELSTKTDVIKMMKESLFSFDTEKTIQFNQLRKLFNDDTKFFDWITETNKMKIGNAVSALLELKSKETDEFQFFNLIKLEENSSNECGMINIKDIVKVSIFFVSQLNAKLLNHFIQMINKSEVIDENHENFHERIGQFKIQSEFNRSKAQQWFEEISKNQSRITTRYGKPKPNELNCLFHLKSLLGRFDIKSQQEIVNFAFTLNPKSIDDFFASCDFTCTYLNNAMEKYSVEQYKTQKTKEELKSIRLWRGKKTTFCLRFSH
jgi:Domain of unknown function (DUF4781)